MRQDEMGLSYREDEIEETWNYIDRQSRSPYDDAAADINWLVKVARTARRYARFAPPSGQAPFNAFEHLRHALSEKP